MRPDCVIVATPSLDQDFRFLQGIEDLTIETFIAQPGVETFDVTVLPG